MRDIINIVVAAVIVSVGYSFLYRNHRDQWEEKVEVALETASRAEAQAAVFAALADSAEARAAARDTVVTERVRVVRERVVELREVEVPAIARPFVAARDSVIGELLDVVDQKDEVIAGYIDVTSFLRQESGKFELRGDSLKAVLDERPGPRKWWIPQTGVGAFLGMCTNGGVCNGVGLTLSWSL